MAEESVAVAPSPEPQQAQAPPPSSGAESPASIEVTPAAIDKGPAQPKPKPGTAKSRMFQELRQKYGGEEPEKPSKGKETDATDAHDTSGDTGEQTAAAETPSDTPTGDKPAAQAGDKKKVSPWKLVDEHKAARAKLEQELNEIKKTVGDPAQLKKQVEAIQSIQKRNQELEEEIRYVNYQKSAEFKDKYQKPYEEAWTKWMGELGELTVTDSDTGAERALQPQDLLELVNMPLQKARARAVDIYGAYADDVMTARKEIRTLFDAQAKALEEARKTGDGWQARMQQEFNQKRQAVTKEIGEVWTKANQTVINDETYGKFFKPVEGDEEINTRLTKGFELADKAFSVNPFDPRLTPQQRAEIVQLHAAVRNRAAAFGRLSLENQRLAKKLATATSELNKYKQVEPPAAGGQEVHQQSGQGSARDEVFAGLRKYAH